MAKCQVFSSSSQTSPFEQSIHQQESGWLQGSGSPYTVSRTTIPVPLSAFLPLSTSFFLHISMHHSSLLSSCELSPRPSFCFFSLSGLLYFFFPPGAITLSLPPSHRLGSKTGAGSWEAINHQKRGIRALLQSKRLQTLLHNR